MGGGEGFFFVKKNQKTSAQLALNRHSGSDLGGDGDIQAGAGCRGAPDPGEMEPAQIVVEVFGGDHLAAPCLETAAWLRGERLD